MAKIKLENFESHAVYKCIYKDKNIKPLASFTNFAF